MFLEIIAAQSKSGSNTLDTSRRAPANLVSLKVERLARVIGANAHDSPDGHHQAFGLCVSGAASAYQEARSGDDGRADRHDHQAPKEGRAGEDRWARSSASAEPCCPYGPQSDDRGSDPHQG